MQERAVDAACLLLVPVRVAIDRIAEDGTSQVLQVNSNLVCAPCANEDSHERAPGVARETVDYRECRPPAWNHGHAKAVGWVAPDRLVHDSARLQHKTQQALMELAHHKDHATWAAPHVDISCRNRTSFLMQWRRLGPDPQLHTCGRPTQTAMYNFQTRRSAKALIMACCACEVLAASRTPVV
eukprot:3883061-Pleurochrysis_carterae.AAC.2